MSSVSNQSGDADSATTPRTKPVRRRGARRSSTTKDSHAAGISGTVKILMLGDSGVGKTALMHRFTSGKFVPGSQTTVGMDLSMTYVSIPTEPSQPSAPDSDHVMYAGKAWQSQSPDRGPMKPPGPFDVATPQSVASTAMQTPPTQPERERIRVVVWDTAGQERFRSLTAAYFRGAHGVMICFDVTARDSFEDVTHWLAEVQKHLSSTAGAASYAAGLTSGASNDSLLSAIMLVGNKSDLHGEREVSGSEAASFAAEHNLVYVEVSAKKGEGVDTAYDRLVSAAVLELKAQGKWKGSQGPAGHTPSITSKRTADGVTVAGSAGSELAGAGESGLVSVDKEVATKKSGCCS